MTPLSKLGVTSSWTCVLSLCMAASVLFLKDIARVRSQSLYVCRGVGVQLTTIRGMFKTESSAFHVNSAIQDLVINEAITCHRILPYAIFLIRTSPELGEQLEVLFPALIPRLNDLVNVCFECREILFAEYPFSCDSNRPFVAPSKKVD
eukprot:CFRG4440T1